MLGIYQGKVIFTHRIDPRGTICKCLLMSLKRNAQQVVGNLFHLFFSSNI